MCPPPSPTRTTKNSISAPPARPLSWSRAKGISGGVSLGGATLRRRRDFPEAGSAARDVRNKKAHWESRHQEDETASSGCNITRLIDSAMLDPHLGKGIGR